jgi:hypothetical protein
MDLREDQHEFACLPLERLEAEITTLAGHLAAAECRWLLLVAEFDRRRGYEQWVVGARAIGWAGSAGWRSGRPRSRFVSGAPWTTCRNHRGVRQG